MSKDASTMVNPRDHKHQFNDDVLDKIAQTMDKWKNVPINVTAFVGSMTPGAGLPGLMRAPSTRLYNDIRSEQKMLDEQYALKSNEMAADDEDRAQRNAYIKNIPQSVRKHLTNDETIRAALVEYKKEYTTFLDKLRAQSKPDNKTIEALYVPLGKKEDEITGLINNVLKEQGVKQENHRLAYAEDIIERARFERAYFDYKDRQKRETSEQNASSKPRQMPKGVEVEEIDGPMQTPMSKPAQPNRNK